MKRAQTRKTELVAICGPVAAAPFLSRLHGELTGRGLDCILWIGALESAADVPRWPEVKVLVAYATPCTAVELSRASALRAIVVPSLGYEAVDVEAATAHGVLVANGQVQENFDTVAEAAVLFILMALYDVGATQERLRRATPRSGPPTAMMLRGKTVGVIGYGNIARSFIRRLENWAVHIMVHTRTPPALTDGRLRFVDLQTLLQGSDIVLPLVSLSVGTRHLLNRERLLLMREGAILVNLSRGAVVDEAALGDRAVAERLRAIALDVFETEPLPANSPLRSLPNTILTPHEIAHTRENIEAMFERAVDNVLAAMAGRVPETTLNREIEDAWLASAG